MTNSAGAVQARYEYDPYGKRTKQTGMGRTLDMDFGYTGHYHHAPSGLILTLYRAYNPAVGRWISRDPIGEAGGINLYGYVGNNSLRFVDPLGLTEDDPQGFGDAEIVATMGGPRGIYIANQAPTIVQNTAREGVTTVAMAVIPGERLLATVFRWLKKCKRSTADLAKGSSLPRNLREQLALEQAAASPAAGTRLPINMTDPRWPASQGWEKWQRIVEPGGSPINVHYLWNPVTGQTADFKIILR